MRRHVMSCNATLIASHVTSSHHIISIISDHQSTISYLTSLPYDTTSYHIIKPGQQQRAYVLLSEDLATLAKTPKTTSTTAATGTTAIQRGSRGEELDSLKTVTAQLKVQLLTATELFNEICMPFKVRNDSAHYG